MAYDFPMPVYLPPISRRRFLKRSLAASALMLAGGCATPKSTADGEGWALLSDIHIAADANLIHGNVNMTRNLRLVTEEVVARPEPVSGVLISASISGRPCRTINQRLSIRPRARRPLCGPGTPIGLCSIL